VTPEAFFDAVALPSLVAELGASTTTREPRPSAVIAELWGITTLPDDVARMIDVLGSAPPRANVVRGSFYAFAASDFLPPDVDSSFTFMLAEWFRRIALLTQTIPLGNNGGGDIWFAEVHRESSRVFLLDHDEMQLSIIADSMASFAHLVHLENDAAKREVDIEEWSPLEGRVRGGRDIRVPKGLRALDVEAGRDLSDRGAAVDELLGCLWYGHEPRAKAAESASAAGDVSTDVRIEELVRAFLRGDDALTTLLEQSRDHAAGIVRAACAFLEAHRSERHFM
jgi:hypothetical protein